MVAVWVVQVAVDQIIDVIAVRYGFMAAIRAVLVLALVAAAIVLRSAISRVGCVHFHCVALNPAISNVMQVAVVQVIDVVAVFHGGVAAVGAVLVTVVRVKGMLTHFIFLSFKKPSVRLF